MYADTSPSCVSMIGRAVSEPPPFSSDSFTARSSRRLCKVEDVAGERLAAGRAAEQQRELAVGGGLLGRSSYTHSVASPFHMKYSAIAQPAYGAMYCSGAGSAAVATTTVVYSIAPAGLQHLDDARDGRFLRADRDVEALHALALLVDDRVDRDRRLAGLAVADDQLALAAADRDHRVDGLDAGLQRLGHRLPVGDAGAMMSIFRVSC
jgi:hypothetical protein